MISHKHKFVFIHIPKTGGTSIWRALKPTVKDLRYLGHVDKEHKQHGPLIQECLKNNYFVSTCVRNPWDVMVSNYFYIRKDGSFWHSSDGSTRYKLKVDHSLVKKLSFKQFIKKLEQGKIKDKFVVRSQSSWINGIDMDDIIRFENINEGFRKICNKLELPNISLPKLNATEHKPYWEYYDDESQKLIANKYKDDIEQFGYEFGK